MSKGIVKSTPTRTGPGKLKVTEAYSNPYHVIYGATLNFTYNISQITVKVGDTVECQITSGATCNVIRVLIPAP